MKVLITGASGMLGRSLMRLLSADPETYQVVGTGLTRAEPPLRRLDLTDEGSARAILDELRPDFVVHCAAERDPDRADQDPEGVLKLNVAASGTMARLCVEHNATIIYISTDYVFDGGVVTEVLPPYGVDAPTEPVNFYGRSKRDGELAILAEGGPVALTLRVPVLYAQDCKDVSESASLIVAKSLLKTGEQTVDDWGVRFPTSVDDVAVVLKAILDLKAKDASSVSGILHCSSGEFITKYRMAIMMAEILELPSDHLRPDPNPPAGAPRPQNTQLDCSATWAALGFEHSFTPLRSGLESALRSFKETCKA